MKNAEQKTDFSVWLLPSNEIADSLREIISSLSDHFDAPFFDPHLTLFCGSSSDLDQTKLRFEKLVKNQPKIKLNAQSISATERFYQTLFIEFDISKAVQDLNEHVKNDLDQQSAYPFSPHLSLLYKDFDLKESGDWLKK